MNTFVSREGKERDRSEKHISSLSLKPILPTVDDKYSRMVHKSAKTRRGHHFISRRLGTEIKALVQVKYVRGYLVQIAYQVEKELYHFMIDRSVLYLADDQRAAK